MIFHDLRDHMPNGRRVGWSEGGGIGVPATGWRAFVEPRAFATPADRPAFFVFRYGPWEPAVCHRPGDPESRAFPVPGFLLAAWLAGEDWRPVIDYLVETYPEHLDWLGDLAAGPHPSPQETVS